jgi:hypothetical protein
MTSRRNGSVRLFTGRPERSRRFETMRTIGIEVTFLRRILFAVAVLASVALCMASAWCEPRHVSLSAAWQPEQTWPPTNFAGSSASA